MARPCKENVAFSMKLEKKTYQRFRAYADKMGQNYTVCLERIINGYLDEKEKKSKDTD